MRSRTPMIVLAVLAAVAAPTFAQQKDGDPVAAMKAGKELFEKSCRLCHDLDRALFPAREPSVWPQIVKRMVTYGAPLNAQQRPLVIRYLAAHSMFAGKCSACHEVTRVVSEAPGPRDWKALTRRMIGHVRELEKQGKAPSGAALSETELEEIAAMLEVVIP